jgi:hypothetical protein
MLLLFEQNIKTHPSSGIRGNSSSVSHILIFYFVFFTKYCNVNLRRKKWAGYVARMGAMKKASEIMFENPEERPLERSRRRYKAIK